MLFEEVVRLSPMGREGVILQELITLEFVTYRRLESVLWPLDDGGPLTAGQMCKQLVRGLRTALRPEYRIVSQWGIGYRLEKK